MITAFWAAWPKGLALVLSSIANAELLLILLEGLWVSVLISYGRRMLSRTMHAMPNLRVSQCMHALCSSRGSNALCDLHFLTKAVRLNMRESLSKAQSPPDTREPAPRTGSLAIVRSYNIEMNNMESNSRVQHKDEQVRCASSTG
jgi:hypothetical protein